MADDFLPFTVCTSGEPAATLAEGSATWLAAVYTPALGSKASVVLSLGGIP